MTAVKPAVHQFVPVFEPGAVGAHILEIRATLRDAGYPSDVFAEQVDPRYSGEGGKLLRAHAAAARPDDVLVYHMAIGSPVADYVRARPETLLVDHHNLTPAEYLDAWAPGTGHGVTWGRRQLAELAGRCTLGLADSAYNEAELIEAGYPRTVVLPILLDTEAFGRVVDTDAVARLRAAKAGGGADWLFVGRVAPNKCQHDVVKAFAAYRQVHDPRARLHIVGAAETGQYRFAIERYVHALGLDDAVTLTGAVSAGVLAAHYATADVFVCLSEHEGFCVPLLEAMHHGVPIVAYGAAAVPETLGEAGLVLPTKESALVAAAVARVVTDGALRAELTTAASERLAAFALDRTRARLLELVDSVLATRRGEVTV